MDEIRTPRPSATFVLSVLFSSIAVIFLTSMVFLFIWQSAPVWKQEGIAYLTGHRWFFRTHEFGVLPMVYGTLVVAAVAIAFAAPIGVGAAIFISEALPRRLAVTVKVIIELLAGIPSVVYGLLGVLYLRTWVYDSLTPFDPVSGDTLLTAGFLLAVMILPTVVTLSEDGFRDVASAQRMAARGLGLNRSEAIVAVVFPQARTAVVSAVLLALGRALGETTAVFLVVGRQDNQWPRHLFSLQPLMESGQTITSKLGGSEVTIAYGDPVHWAAIVGLGLFLLGIAIIATLAAVQVGRQRSADA
ncbi:MAG TPA: phosphate ABC transporter permease subunit PstC [Steroidobacteraceae bacterium]